MLDPAEINLACQRIKNYINKTPILESKNINDLFGNKLLFKYEGAQKTRAFKVRGALNTIISLKESGNLPAHITAFSSGNHAQAVAYASSLFGIKSTIFIPEFCSQIKIEATRSYGAEVILTKTRSEAEQKVMELQERQGAYLIAPFDNDMVIAGQGTSCFEALSDGIDPDVIFATCGGGGLLSGTYLAKELLFPLSKIYGCEPKQANDASISYRTGKIFSFDSPPDTVADGARTPKISERTFEYLKKLDGFIEVSEDEIIEWTKRLTAELKEDIEPTSAVATAAAYKYRKENQIQGKTFLIIISGGNV